MKYQTIVLDVNKPALKQVKVPLESDYGVAVKVCKDGQYVEDATFALDGLSAASTRNGWQLFELSSGPEPRTKTLSAVAYLPKGSTHCGMTGTKTLENQQQFPVSLYADFPLSDAGLGDFAKLDAPKT